MVIGRMAFLRGFQSTRGMMTQKSEDNLTRFAVVHPDLGRGFFKSVSRLGAEVKSIVFPESLFEPQNLPVVRKFNQDPAFARSILTAKGAIDFTKAGLKQSPEVRDLTRDFEDLKLLDDLKHSFTDTENLAAMGKSKEVRDLTLYQDLWLTRALLYRLEGEKAAAKKTGDETLICQSRASIVAVAGYLEELAAKFPIEGVLDRIPEEFPYGPDSPAQKILRAAELLRRGNTSPADTSLRVLTEKINKEIELFEKARVAREWRGRRPATRQPERPIEETLVHLAKRRYKVSFSAEGLMIMPQGGFRSAGPVRQKQIIGHRVPEDKAVRREQHRIDSISRQISINSNFEAILSGFARGLRASEGIDDKQLISGLAGSYLAYEKGIVMPKFRTRLFIKVALELSATAAKLDDRDARARLFGFAADMCDMAARELSGLTRNLGEQLDRIVPKQALIRTIIAENIRQETEIRSILESVRLAISSRKIVNDPRFAWMVRKLTAEAKEGITPAEEPREWIVSCLRRIVIVTNLLAMVGRLNSDKERLRQEYLAARDRSILEIQYLNGKKAWEKMADALRTGAEYAEAKLKAIADADRQIAGAVGTIMRETLLTAYDLEHKNEGHRYADQKRKVEVLSEGRQAYLAEKAAELEAVGKLYAGARPVYGTVMVEDPATKKWEYRERKIGDVLPAEVETLKLRDKPKYPLAS